jgi:hypothetical protein
MEKDRSWGELLELEPVEEILDFNCPRNDPIEELYGPIPKILVPVLLKKLQNSDSCFSQVIRLCFNKNTNEVNVCQGYEEIGSSCDRETTRFIIYYIDLVFIKNEVVDGRHSEAVLVDTLFNTIEFFEPNGPAADWYDVVNSYLEYHLTQLYPEYKYLPTGEFCPYYGPQAKSGLGICGSFSLLFLILRIYNEDLTSGELIGKLVNLSKTNLTDLMYKFICYILEYADMNNLFAIQDLYDRIMDVAINIEHLRQMFDELYLKLDYQGLLQSAELYGII